MTTFDTRFFIGCSQARACATVTDQPSHRMKTPSFFRERGHSCPWSAADSHCAGIFLPWAWGITEIPLRPVR